MLGQVRQANRLGLSDDEAKNAVTTRRRADPGRHFRVDPVGRELLEHSPVRREDADGCVPGPDDLCRHFHGALKDTFEGDLCDERRRGRHELLQALLVGWKLHDGWYRHTERYLKLSVVIPEQSLSASSPFLHSGAVRLYTE